MGQAGKVDGHGYDNMSDPARRCLKPPFCRGKDVISFIAMSFNAYKRMAGSVANLAGIDILQARTSQREGGMECCSVNGLKLSHIGRVSSNIC